MFSIMQVSLTIYLSVHHFSPYWNMIAIKICTDIRSPFEHDAYTRCWSSDCNLKSKFSLSLWNVSESKSGPLTLAQIWPKQVPPNGQLLTKPWCFSNFNHKELFRLNVITHRTLESNSDLSCTSCPFVRPPSTPTTATTKFFVQSLFTWLHI